MNEGYAFAARRTCAHVLLAAMGMMAGSAALAADAPTGGEPGTRTFVLSNIFFASPHEAGTCAIAAAGGLESFLSMLPAKEQAQYADPSTHGALERRMYEHFGFKRVGIVGRDPGGKVVPAKLPDDFKPGDPLTLERAKEIGALNGFPKNRGRPAFQNQTVAYNSCTNPEDFPQLSKGYRLYDGTKAIGSDLDGKQSKRDFTSLDGKPGVDNQLWHAIGCIKAYSEEADRKIAMETLTSARAPTLIELRGVDDLRNDPDVTVNIYAAADALSRNGRRAAQAWASFKVNPDPALRATVRGRIVDGVLTTDPVDLRLNYKEQIVDAPRDLKGTHIRMTFNPDGSVEGGFDGYYTLDSFYNSVEQMTLNGANLTGISCPGVRQAIDRLADGYRDPKTKRFTAISSALNFFGVPAFIVTLPDQVAGAQSAPQPDPS